MTTNDITKQYLLLPFILVFSHMINAFGQEVNRLHIDEELPDSLLNLIDPIDEGNGRIHANKAVILEFGTTRCPPCIKSLLKLDSLQHKFADDLQVYFVTTEPRDAVVDLFVRKGIHSTTKILTITEDSLLHKLFVHVTQPHYVWIGRDRYVAAITDHRVINDHNISLLVDGEPMNLPQKWDFPYDYGVSMTEFNSRNFTREMIPNTLQSTIITTEIKGVVPRMGVQYDSTKNNVRYFAINQSLVNMYAHLFGEHWGTSFLPAHVMLCDSVELFNEQTFDARVNSQGPVYSYDISFREDLPDSAARKRIIQLLNWSFGIEVRIDSITRRCWVIRANGKARATPTHKRGHQIDGIELTLRSLVFNLNCYPGQAPTIDQVDLPPEERKALRFFINESSLSDRNQLKKELACYGLALTSELRETETMIVERMR